MTLSGGHRCLQLLRCHHGDRNSQHLPARSGRRKSKTGIGTNGPGQEAMDGGRVSGGISVENFDTLTERCSIKKKARKDLSGDVFSFGFADALTERHSGLHAHPSSRCVFPFVLPITVRHSGLHAHLSRNGFPFRWLVCFLQP